MITTQGDFYARSRTDRQLVRVLYRNLLYWYY
jgi:hypothetical protein